MLCPTGLIPWFSKTEGNTYATLLHHPFLFKGKPTHAQEVARRISGTVAREVYAKVNIPSTHHNPYLSHYIIFHLPLVFLSPTSPLPFYSPSLFRSLFFTCFLFARVLDCLLVTMAQHNTKLCDFANTNNNDFLSTPIAPLANTESCHERSIHRPS